MWVGEKEIEKLKSTPLTSILAYLDGSNQPLLVTSAQACIIPHSVLPYLIKAGGWADWYPLLTWRFCTSSQLLIPHPSEVPNQFNKVRSDHLKSVRTARLSWIKVAQSLREPSLHCFSVWNGSSCMRGKGLCSSKKLDSLSKWSSGFPDLQCNVLLSLLLSLQLWPSSVMGIILHSPNKRYWWISTWKDAQYH